MTLERFPVGYWADDARDILAAKSLLMGAYNNLQLPWHPPANFPLPGFPLLLAPFVGFTEEPWTWLKAVPLLMTWMSLAGLYRLWKDDLSSKAIMVVIALFALNPTTLVFSNQVISDASYLFLLLVVLISFRRITSDPRLSPGSLLLSTTAAALVRPEGMLLFLALGIVCLWQKYWKTFWCLFGGALCWSGMLIWNYTRTGALSGYQTLFNETLPFLAQGPWTLVENGWAIWKTVTMELVLGVSYQPTGIGGHFLIMGLSLGLLGGLFRGFHAWIQKRPEHHAFQVSVGLYVLLHMGVHTFWLANHPHYFWPLLPFIAFLMIYAVEAIAHEQSRRVVYVLAGVLLLGAYGSQTLFALNETGRGRRDNKLPTATYEWVRSQSPKDAFFLAPNGAALSLRTNRYSLSYIQADDQDDFRAKLLDSKITHVLVHPIQFLHVRAAPAHDPNRRWRDFSRWIQKNPSAYEPVFQNHPEHTTIYTVRVDPRFLKAYARFRSIRQSPPASLSEQWTLLEEAIRIDPLPCLLNAYGVTALLSGQKQALAIRRLRQALLQRPDYMIAWINLARLYKQTGQVALSRKAYQTAYEIADHEADPQRWQAVISNELRSFELS